MSTEFNKLRELAREKRDKAIKEIRREYEATLVQICALEQDLLGKVSTRYVQISRAIESVIPREDPFTVADIVTRLEAADPTRDWRRRSIDNQISRLRKRGILKRIKRATIHEAAQYVRAEVPVKVAPLDDMTLMEVIGKVLTKPMTTTEVMVAALEAGWQTTMKKRTYLRNHVTTLLGRGWKMEDGKWMP